MKSNVKSNGKRQETAGMDHDRSPHHNHHYNSANRHYWKQRTVIRVTEEGEVIPLSKTKEEARILIKTEKNNDTTIEIYGDARVKQLEFKFYTDEEF